MDHPTPRIVDRDVRRRDVLRHPGRRVGASRCAARGRRSGFAQHTDGGGAGVESRRDRARRARRAGGRVRRPRDRARRRARGVAVHERHGGGQLPPRRRRGRAVRHPDVGGHVRPAAGTARCRRPADDRSDPPVLAIGPLVPRPRSSRPRRCSDMAIAGVPGPQRRPPRSGAPEPAVPRAAHRHAR